ncbi:tRNA (guanine(10)-N(2))-dimethyltransferase, partial [Candidatus Woesearchaeota archaeon CG10_big_fil_rev_8_21_14_0_10_47_5]
MQLKEIHEGAAALRIYAPKGAVSKSLPVFYNPIMRLNRDIGVLILSCLDKKGMQIADIMAGSGVRAVRLALELPAGRAGLIVANDASPDAVRFIEANLRLN